MRLGPYGCLALAAVAVASAGEWEPLCNGRDLDGWKVECRDRDRGINYWWVTNGVIECNTAGDRKHDYVWLVTDREFGDFELEGQVQTFGNSTGNSGIQIRSRFLQHSEKGHWLHGPQIDIHPPGPWRCGLIYDETWKTRRWISPPMPKWNITPDEGPAAWRWIHADGRVESVPASDSAVQAGPTGAWNRLRITARGLQIKVDVNGIPITRFDGTGILDDDAHRRHRVGRRGHIALQLHSRDDLKIRFRNLRIRELEPDNTPSPVMVVHDDAQLRSALEHLGPGSVVRIAPGRYRPGLRVSNAHGTEDQPVVIEGLDPRDPPLFEGGSQAWHLSNVSHLTLRWINCRGQKHNGINLDDGATMAHTKPTEFGSKTT